MTAISPDVLTERKRAARARSRKNERVYVRLSESAKSTLERAASVSGSSSLTDFVLNSALKAAERTIEEYEVMRLTAEDRAVFLEAISNPPKPNRKLKSAVKRYKALSK
jgi:uncharacterized protein (DUF1778 family)